MSRLLPIIARSSIHPVYHGGHCVCVCVLVCVFASACYPTPQCILPRGGLTSECHLEYRVPLYYGYNGARDDKQNGVDENFQVVCLQNRKVLEE